MYIGVNLLLVNVLYASVIRRPPRSGRTPAPSPDRAESRSPSPYAWATTMYREMDMRFWLEQAETEIKELG
jgi:hypothetical protein